jgi:diacylglycerol kinase family enzyme
LQVDGNAPLFIVFNPRSGARNSDEACARITAVLNAAGRVHRLMRVDRRHRVGELAAQAVAEAQRAGGIVVAAGGDGTLNTVAGAAHAAGCPFGVIAQGTFNYFARIRAKPPPPCWRRGRTRCRWVRSTAASSSSTPAWACIPNRCASAR